MPGTESWNGIDQLVGAVGGRDAEVLQAIWDFAGTSSAG